MKVSLNWRRSSERYSLNVPEFSISEGVSMGAVKERALQVSALFVALAVWAIVAVWVDLPSAIPPPVDVFDRLGGMIASGGVTGPLFSTLSRTAMGFVVGFIAGVAYGILAHARPAFG